MASMFAIAITSRVLILAEKASRMGYTLGCSLYRAIAPYLIGIRYGVIFNDPTRYVYVSLVFFSLTATRTLPKL